MISDEDLRQRLARFYPHEADIPPITSTTRSLLVTKLSNMEQDENGTEINQKLHLNEVEVVVQPKQDQSDGCQVAVRPKAEDIATLVFFDLESTGIKRDTFQPKITELSFVGVGSSDFLDYRRKLLQKMARRKSAEIEFSRPRVLSKLTICVNPQSMVPLAVTDVTGLDNCNLESQSVFDATTVDTLRGFLQRLPQPVCLVAHNGNHFDFPLLNAELNTLGERLDVLCIDSLVGLRQILKTQQKEVCIPPADDPAPKRPKPSADEDRCCPEPVSSSKPVDVFEGSPDVTGTPVSKRPPEDALHPPPLAPKQPRPDFCDIDLKVKKKLDFGSGDFTSGPPSFSLPKLHEHVFARKPRVSHGAEEDCLSLMRVCAFKAEDFLRFTQQNACQLSTLRKMW